jgi:hypothetical protein
MRHAYRINIDEKYNKPSEESEESIRLTLAGLPVFLTLSLIFGFFYIDHTSHLLNELTSGNSESYAALREEIFPVLIEQADRKDPYKNEKRALSDVSSAGAGRLTKEEGFHSLTPYDQLRISAGGGNSQQSALRNQSAQSAHASYMPSDSVIWTADDGIFEKSSNENPDKENKENKNSDGKDLASVSAPASSGEEPEYKIPANYRFRSDFVLHYDDSARLIIARQELKGFRYFQGMLRQIRSGFSPPGYNFAYRDFAGIVINQPVKPQTVQVLFSLDPDGRVRDVRVTASLGQIAVDQACINSLAGQNFGPPPPEIFEHGNIFGINFIFPAYFNEN